jgi:hypothetical protein
MMHSSSYTGLWKELYRRPFVLFLAVFFIGVHLFFLLSHHFFPKWFSKITAEDQFLENLSILLYASGSVIALWIAIRFSHGLKRFWFLGFSAVLFIMAGEEWSWGQRFFNYNVPSIESINIQSEFNLHNLEAINNESFNTGRLLSLGSLGIGIVIPIALTCSSWLRRLSIDVLHFPVPHPVLGVCFLLSWLWYRGMCGADPREAVPIEESRETTIALGMFVYMLLLLLYEYSEVRDIAVQTKIAEDLEC